MLVFSEPIFPVVRFFDKYSGIYRASNISLSFVTESVEIKVARACTVPLLRVFNRGGRYVYFYSYVRAYDNADGYFGIFTFTAA